MGGVKKKPLSQMEKAQRLQEEKEAARKAKATREKESKSLSWSAPRLTDEQAIKLLSPLKAITIYSAARALGTKASVASAVIRSLENRGILKREAGYSGHYVYSLVKEAAP